MLASGRPALPGCGHAPAAARSLRRTADRAGDAASGAVFVPDAAFIDKIRRELMATLEMVRATEALPWPEMRYRSIVRYLPEDEAARLRADFDAEMMRIYEIEDRKAGFLSDGRVCHAAGRSLTADGVVV